MIITVYKLWEDGVFTGSCPMQLNCDQLQGQPYRPAWLLLTGCCSPVNFQLTFREPPAGNYFLTGILVNYKRSVIILDAVSIEALVAACDLCCGPDDVIVPGIYNGILPPLPVPPELTLYMIEREDNGSISAFNKVLRDYYGQYSMYYPLNRISYENGVSTYSFYSDKIPYAIAPDTVGLFSADYETNDAPTLGGGQWYVLGGTLGGAPIIPLKATTLDGIVELANQLDYFIAAGTWVVDGEKIRLLGSPYSSGALTLTTETIPVADTIASNVAPTPEPGEELLFTAQLTIDSFDIGDLPDITALNMTDLLAAIQADAIYSLLGTWSLIATDTQVQLSSSLVTGGTVTITADPLPVFQSNEAPALTAGQWYVFTGTLDGDTEYEVKGDDLPEIVALLQIIDVYMDAGGWSVAGEQIVLNSPLGSATLVITAETKAAPTTFESNEAPVLTPGVEEFTLDITVNVGADQVWVAPQQTGIDLEVMAAALDIDPQFALFGAYSATPTVLSLQSSWITSATIVVGKQNI